MYYVFDSVTLEYGYPKPLTNLGLPESTKYVDAAFVWGHNNRTYLFHKSLFWRLDEDTGRVELDYPRDISIWDGIGHSIDAAFQYTNHKTYFFKGFGYWEFNDDRMRVAHNKRLLSARKWMNCPRQPNEVDDEQTWTSPLVSDNNDTEQGQSSSTSSSLTATNTLSSIKVPLLCIVILVLCCRLKSLSPTIVLGLF